MTDRYKVYTKVKKTLQQFVKLHHPAKFSEDMCWHVETFLGGVFSKIRVLLLLHDRWRVWIAFPFSH